MKTKIFNLLIASCVIGLASCESDIDNFMVDDSIGFLNNGCVEADVLSGVSEPYMLYSIKSGKGSQDANVTISVDPQVLSDYNEANGTSYTVLPADCYSLKVANLIFSKEDYRKPFEIAWNQDRLSAAVEADPMAVIPIRMTVAETGVQVNEDRLTVLIKPNIITPYISFRTPGFYTGIMPLVNDNAHSDVYVQIEANFIARTDIEYTLSIDEDLVEAYNNEKNTKYKVLPADAYDLPLSGWTIKQSANNAMFKFTFNLDALRPEGETVKFGEYILPLRLSSVSSTQIDPEASYLLYAISFQPQQLSKEGWTVVDYNSSCKDDETSWVVALDGGVENLIDGTVGKFWYSKWTTPEPLPYYFVFDMQKEHTIFLAGFDNPTGSDAWRGNAKAGYLEISKDNQNWEKIGEWTAPNKFTRTIQYSTDPVPGRYIRFVITEAFDAYQNGAQINIAELNFWGL